ncbi:unnamed protein product [Clonostachys solani]|uniref:NAD dependent epimerase/dehydratase n=1 Tax=Clonostachys solani TaxID=160281 RepID=A0A9P0EJW0_9HYPO|nr:unnamed protein product [Clonostachys solani]
MAQNNRIMLPDRIVPMRVIVCGAQRTGTLSARHALFRLGFYDCYHMHDVRNNPLTDGPQWIRALRAKFAGEGAPFEKEDWDRLLGRCQAVADVPAAFFGPELSEAYPDAKVIILNRDPEKWYNSVLGSIHSDRSLGFKLKMIFCLIFTPEARAWVRFGMIMGSTFGFNIRTEKDKALAWYEKTYEEWREGIPEERRIEYSVGDGWKPLCDHLGVPVPLVEDPESGELVEPPFPHVNDRSSFLGEMAHVQAGWVSKGVDNLFGLIGRTAVYGSAAYVGYLVWKTRLGGRF